MPPDDAAPTREAPVDERAGSPADAPKPAAESWPQEPFKAPGPPAPPWHPSYLFLAVVSTVSLVADIWTKLWAEKRLDAYPGMIQLWPNHVAFVLAKNRGGAWGLLQGTSENVRRPFFLLVSVAAIAFIVTLYRKLHQRQKALRWGLPLVLGGALGNVFDRIRYGHVIDFIDVHALYKGHDHHWPTFNIADVAICVGVGLMAVDMFTSKKGLATESSEPHPPASAPPAVEPKP